MAINRDTVKSDAPIIAVSDKVRAAQIILIIDKIVITPPEKIKIAFLCLCVLINLNNNAVRIRGDAKNKISEKINTVKVLKGKVIALIKIKADIT